MSAEVQNNSAEIQQDQNKAPNDKEINFAKIRKQLEEERQARQQAESDKVQLMEQINRLASQKSVEDDDISSDEPYVDHKNLEKKLARFGQKAKQETQNEIKNEVQKALSEERKTNWLKNNPDFYEVMGHAQTFAEKDPELAETILQMPDTFERQKLVYKNIKALKMHVKEDPKSNIQDKVDQNRRSPYYQPSGVGSAPYGVVNGGKDYSPAEGKNAYAKMQELKSKLRI